MSDPTAFIEELIQLQIKHKVILEGYDVTLWTEEAGIAAAARHNKPEFLVTEEKIRERWQEGVHVYKGD